MKNTIIAVIVLLILGVGGFFFWKSTQQADLVVVNTTPTTTPVVTTPTPTPATSSPAAVVDKTKTVLGTSVGGRNITAYHFGEGNKELLFVAGAHGGYEWNTTLVAYQLMDYLKANPTSIPSGVRVTVVPALNPDGLFKVVGTDSRFTAADVSASKEVTVSGRYNGNNVDLNRNFDCDWQETGVWQSTKVSGGSAPFSEPESKAIQSYVAAHKPTAVVEWFSSAGGVFSSRCGGEVSAETAAITKIYADASGYPAFKDFDSYEITGDMVNWLAKSGIPAISVLLSDHSSTEWTKNKAGIDALLQHYAK
jgi:hypothetical protein